MRQGICAIVCLSLFAVSGVHAAMLDGDMRVTVGERGVIGSIYVEEQFPHDGFITGYAEGMGLIYGGSVQEFFAISAQEWGGELDVNDPFLEFQSGDTSADGVLRAVTEFEFFPVVVTQTASFPAAGPGENTLTIDVVISNPTSFTLHNVRFARGIVPGVTVLGFQPGTYVLEGDRLTACFAADWVGADGRRSELSQDVTLSLVAGSDIPHRFSLLDAIYGTPGPLSFDFQTETIAQQHFEWDGQAAEFKTMALVYLLDEIGPGEQVAMQFQYAVTVPEPASLALVMAGGLALLRRRW